jgi:hypothetical protein
LIDYFNQLLFTISDSSRDDDRSESFKTNKNEKRSIFSVEDDKIKDRRKAIAQDYNSKTIAQNRFKHQDTQDIS